MITSNLFEDEIIGNLKILDRMVWIGLITLVDDQGRTADIPGIIRSRIFPYDEIAIKEIDEALSNLAESNRINRYEADGKKCIQINNWWKHQRSQWAGKSNLPAPEGWTDRARYNSSDGITETNWKADGGYNNTPVTGVDGGVDGGVVTAPALTEVKLSKDKLSRSEDEDKLATAAAEKLQTVYDIYSNNIGLLTPIITEQIKAAVKVYSVDWIDAAIQEAIHNNVRRWNYVRAILDRWQRDGFQSKAGKKPEENYKRFAGVDIDDQIEQPEQIDLAKEFAGIIKMPVPSGPTLDDWRGYLDRMTNNGITMDMMREACKDKVVFHPSQIFKECERMLL